MKIASAPTPSAMKRRQFAVFGVTMPEVLVALCISSIGFVAIWTASGQCLQLARNHRETLAATEVLLRRVEDSRAAGWGNVVTAAGIQANILQTAAVEASLLPGAVELVTVTPYPAVTPAPTPIVVRRNADGTVQIISQPAAGLYLRSLLAVRADFQVTWKSGSNQRARKREVSTVIAVQALLR